LADNKYYFNMSNGRINHAIHYKVSWPIRTQICSKRFT